MASREVQEVQQAGPLTGQQRVRPALEAWGASREEQEEQHQALEALVASQVVLVAPHQALEASAASLEEQEERHQALEASPEEQEERHQALEAWGASQGVLEAHRWVALAALAVGREA